MKYNILLDANHLMQSKCERHGKKIVQTHHNIWTLLLSQQSLSKAKNTNSTSAFAQHSMVNQRFNIILALVKEAIIDRMVDLLCTQEIV